MPRGSAARLVLLAVDERLLVEKVDLRAVAEPARELDDEDAPRAVGDGEDAVVVPSAPREQLAPPGGVRLAAAAAAQLELAAFEVFANIREHQRDGEQRVAVVVVPERA